VVGVLQIFQLVYFFNANLEAGHKIYQFNNGICKHIIPELVDKIDLLGLLEHLENQD
jgi:hypothetical protein